MKTKFGSLLPLIFLAGCLAGCNGTSIPAGTAKVAPGPLPAPLSPAPRQEPAPAQPPVQGIPAPSSPLLIDLQCPADAGDWPAWQRLLSGELPPPLFSNGTSSQNQALAEEIQRCGLGFYGPKDCRGVSEFHPVAGQVGCAKSAERIDFYTVFAADGEQQFYYQHVSYERIEPSSPEKVRLASVQIHAIGQPGPTDAAHILANIRAGQLTGVIESAAETPPSLQSVIAQIKSTQNPAWFVSELARYLNELPEPHPASELATLLDVLTLYPVGRVDDLSNIYRESYLVSLQTLWLASPRDGELARRLQSISRSVELTYWIERANLTLSQETASLLGMLGEPSEKALRILREQLENQAGPSARLSRAMVALAKIGDHSATGGGLQDELTILEYLASADPLLRQTAVAEARKFVTSLHRESVEKILRGLPADEVKEAQPVLDAINGAARSRGR